jgi:hypothetical protein
MSHPLRWLALVALERPELPAFERLVAWLHERFPNAPELQAAGSTENLQTLTIGDQTAAVTLAPRPIPPSQLEGPAATAWYWPEAAGRLKDHSAHLLVTLIDEGGPAVKKAEALTQLTAAVAATAPSVGVFWGPGRLVHSPQAFLDQAVQMREGDLPLFLWIDFRIEPIGETAHRLYTTGLEALGRTEIEVPRFEGQPQELLDFAYNIAHYLVDTRKTINDGDTIGLTDQVQATARHGRSMLGGELEVISLEFERENQAPSF